jgi:hypothetical protein
VLDVNWYSDNTTLLASNCSSCEVQDDKSAYWTPQLYYAHNNGTFEEVPNYGMTVYFLGEQRLLKTNLRLTLTAKKHQHLLAIQLLSQPSHQASK